MSRKGKQVIPLPPGVDVTTDGLQVTVKGPKGTLFQTLIPGIGIKVAQEQLVVEVDPHLKEGSRFHGLYCSLLAGMVEGTSRGFLKELELVGIGYRVAVQGDQLDLQFGFSHPMKLPIPKGIGVKVDKNFVSISGIDKQQVGQYCATLRAIRPPEPYQGKGIRYKGEQVRRKQGKSSGKK